MFLRNSICGGLGLTAAVFLSACAEQTFDDLSVDEENSAESDDSGATDSSETTATAQQAWNVDKYGFFTNGHETILGGGILIANSALGTSYPIVGASETCYWGPTNDLIKGNCATDMPESTIRSYYGIAEAADWHKHAKLQSIHWLRNYTGTTGAVGAWRACINARERIIAATKTALSKFVAGSTSEAHYYIGHASHILQDSFAPIHASRQADSSLILKDVCSYSRSISGVCYHPDFPPDPTTIVAGDSITSYPTLATAATNSTAGYLRAVYQMNASSSRTQCTTAASEGCETYVRKTLQPYFDSASDSYTGMHSCSSLPNIPKVTWTYVGYPSAARKIAGCTSGTIYALNDDKALYSNTSGGVDSGWVYMDTPSAADSIVCIDNVLYAMNTDRRVYKWDTTTKTWNYIRQFGSNIGQIGGTYGRMYLRSSTGYVYTSATPFTATSPVTNVGTYASALSIAGVRIYDPAMGYRAHMAILGGDHNLYLSTGDGRSGTWQYIDRPYYAQEITGGASGKIWALNTDYRLYKGVISE